MQMLHQALRPCVRGYSIYGYIYPFFTARYSVHTDLWNQVHMARSQQPALQSLTSPNSCSAQRLTFLSRSNRPAAPSPSSSPSSPAPRYENVGMSIFIVAVLNVVLTPAFAFAFWLLRKLKQGCLTRCVQTASQEMYDSAWIGDEFLLDYR